jgi:hypothetical protein
VTVQVLNKTEEDRDHPVLTKENKSFIKIRGNKKADLRINATNIAEETRLVEEQCFFNTP